MAAVQTAMVGRMPFTMLRDAIFTHPTISEGLVFFSGKSKAGRVSRKRKSPTKQLLAMISTEKNHTTGPYRNGLHEEMRR